jgi:hypothetical protein
MSALVTVNVTDWPSYAVAGATLVLAIFTAVMAYYAKREAEATVKLVENAKQDRELTWRPWITVEVVRDPSSGGEPKSITVRNMGVGPALRCLYLTRQPRNEWRQLSRFDVPAREKLESIQVDNTEKPMNAGRLRLDPPEDGRESLEHAVICSDIFGNRYRFRLTARPPDIWLRDTEPIPNWAQDLPE